MADFNNERVAKIVYDKIVSEHDKIDVFAGKCRYNFRCSYNAVHDAIKKGDDKIAMVMYMDNGRVDPTIHFINYRKDKFIDNTLGEWSQLNDYYFIKWIEKSDYWDVNRIFGSYRKNLRDSLSWWLRLTSDVTF